MRKPPTAADLQSRQLRLQTDWAKLHASRPRILYHYTDAQGLLGMLKAHRLWATNRRFMNDPTEAEYAANLIKEALLDRRTTDYLARNVGSRKTRERIFETVRTGTQALLSAYVDHDEHYLACFCENGDLLSQWRGYGAVGGGYAVGFVAKHLGLIQYRNPQKPEPILCKVLYDPPQQRELASQWLNFIIDWQRFLDAEPRRGKREIDYGDFGWLGFNWFISQSLRCFKHPAYEEEQEWRVIQVGTAPAGGRAVEPNFRAGRRGIVEYVELDLPAMSDRLPVEVIRYGPTLDPKVTKRSLSLLCHGNGYDKVDIKESVVPFAG